MRLLGTTGLSDRQTLHVQGGWVSPSQLQTRSMEAELQVDSVLISLKKTTGSEDITVNAGSARS